VAVQQEIPDQLDKLIEESGGVTLDLSRLLKMNPQTTKRSIARAAQLSRFTTLDLSYCEVGDAGARAIAEAIQSGH